MKKIFTVFLVVLICLFSVSALESVYDIFPNLSKDQFETLMTEGIEGSTLEDGIVQLYPVSSKIYNEAVSKSEEKNSFSVGVVSFVPYPEDWNSLSDEEKQLKVFNIMTAISTQKGITYISRTAGYKEKTLMEDSYCINNPDKKKKINDPVFDSVPAEYSMYSYQKDNRFGGNVFQLDYENSEEEVFLSIVNKTAMKFMGISCVPKNKLCMYIDTFLTEEGIVVTAMATIYDKEPEINLVIYTVDLQSSFQRRITGFKNWFIQSV